MNKNGKQEPSGTELGLGCQARSKGVMKFPPHFIHWSSQGYWRGLGCFVPFSSRYHKSIWQETQLKTISPPKLIKRAGYLSHTTFPRLITSSQIFYLSSIDLKWQSAVCSASPVGKSLLHQSQRSKVCQCKNAKSWVMVSVIPSTSHQFDMTS